MRDGIDSFFAFHGSNYPNYTIAQIGRATCAATFAETWGTTEKRCCGTTGLERSCIESKRRLAAITTPEKQRMCFAQSLFAS